ncbi:retrovirus-related pol polyprotein from transposon TNT 1-94 [Tanacetum coccineum]
MQIKDYLYQKKLHKPLAEAKPTGMKVEDWTLLDRQALGAVRLSLVKNVACNVVNEKTTYDLFKALSNMYEKPSTSNKVFLIRQLVNTKMKEGASVADHVNEFNSILSSWSGTVIAVSGSTGRTKLKFDNIRDLILGEDIHGRSRTKNQCSKTVTSKDKEVNMAAGDYDDALVCCVENTIDDRIMDSGASFHATYCKEELERFKLRSGMVHSRPKEEVIYVGQLDEEGYHVGFGDQQWKVTKGSLVVARGNKRGSLYMVEVPSDGINVAIDGRGNATLWHQRLRHMSENGMKILASKGRIPDLQKAVVGFCELYVLGKQKKVSFVKSRNTRKLKRFELVHTDVYGPTSVASIGGSRYYVTFIDDSSRKDFKFQKRNGKGRKLGSDEMGYHFWDSKSHKIVRSKDATFNEDSLYGAKAAIDSSNLTKPNQKDQMVLEDSPENLANKSIVVEHGLSSEITQSPEDSEDRASSEEGGSETPHVRRSTRESRALVRYSPSANYLLLTENGEPESYSEALSSKEFIQWKKAINEEMVSLEKNQTWSLIRLPVGKKALQSKWVFRVKEEQDHMKRYKARLVVKGFQQTLGVDYNEIFSLVVKMTPIRLVLSIVAAEDLHLEQLDVKTTFLHSDIDEDIYMTQPKGLQSVGKEENLMAGYERCAMDHCCYLKKVIKKLKRQLSQEFEMKDLGPAKQSLGMSIIKDRTNGTLRLSQEKYTGKVLDKFNMKDVEARCQPLGDHFKLSKKQAPKTEASRRRMANYASSVGSVMYVMVCTRPDIAHAVGVVSRFMSNPGMEHWEVVKWLLRYLKVGVSIGLSCRV